MDILLVLAAVLGVPALLGGLWHWSSRRSTQGKVRRGATGGMLGVVDEIFRPETHQAVQIQKIHHELPTPTPAPKPKS
ncbi:hypothetical protein [Arthrobacter sp. M2012083]|uniref:hypothetical protein n=1 Tax=Arthrobacter sp. M2012083 TaxID=1197706 RepID=UPI0012F9DD47|nr:hypothetical protein [Arthrobacter sp. M2012083]